MRRFHLESLEPRRMLAYAAELVADINTVGSDSDPRNFVAVGDWVFFHTSHGGFNLGHGMELWKTDGTSEGTQRVKQIEPNGDANIRGMIEYNGKLYFFAEEGIHGTELWVSDGTEEGTQLVKDIFPGPGSSNGRTSGEFPNYAVANGKLFFTAADPEHGMELWQSDGTTEGTTLVLDINPDGDSLSSNLARNLVTFDDKLFFVATDGAYGYQIWKSDGTAEGTTRVTEFESSAQPYGPRPGELTPVGNTLFFTGNNLEFGTELWKTDGTKEGTSLVKDIIPGESASYPNFLHNFNGVLLFEANNTESGSSGLFRSDGTEEGTTLIKDGFTDARSFKTVEDKVFFVGRDQDPETSEEIHGHELWITDGTAEGTHIVVDINPGPAHGVAFWQNFGVIGKNVYFQASTPEFGGEFWTSDGTAEGTRLVADLLPGPGTGLVYTSFSFSIPAIGDKLYLGATNGATGLEPWVSDGTAEGTKLLKDITLGTADSTPRLWTGLGDQVVFLASDGIHGHEPWRTDGTTAGTQLIKDIFPGENSSYLTWSFGKGFENFEGHLYFTVKDSSARNNGLWRTDGTEAGTTEVPSAINSFDAPQLFTVSGGQLFFRASDEDSLDTGRANSELWKSDGTEAGTVLVKDIFPGSLSFPGYDGAYINASAPSDLVDVNGKLFFAASDENGRELWTSDGTEAGTVQVADIYPGTYDYFGGVELGNSSNPQHLTALSDGRLFFVASEPDHGRELWTSDGTAAGTRLVKDIFPGGDAPYSSNPKALTALGDKLYFLADDGVHGRELWVSDGTEEGTRMVRDINPGPNGVTSAPYDNYPVLTANNGRLFFYANDGTHGTEVWTSDGSEDGTRLVRDINPGPEGSYTGYFHPWFLGIVPVDDHVAFRANDGVHGYELWTSDGTERGTTMVADINPGPASSYPYAMANVNGTLYFGANDGVLGREPWKLVVVPDPPPVIGDSNHDGVFSPKDLILVFSLGEYEDDIPGNSSFESGDWNGDGDFDSQDLMFAFQAGTYRQHRAPVAQGNPIPAIAADWKAPAHRTALHKLGELQEASIPRRRTLPRVSHDQRLAFELLSRDVAFEEYASIEVETALHKIHGATRREN